MNGYKKRAIYTPWNAIQPHTEATLAIYNNMDEPGGHYAKGNKSEKDLPHALTYM